MAIQTIGIRTSIWNNTIGAVLLFCLLPALIYGFTFTLSGGDKEIQISMVVISLIGYIIIIYAVQFIIEKLNDEKISYKSYKNRDLKKFVYYCCIVLNMRPPKMNIVKLDSINAQTYGISQHDYKLVITDKLMNQPKEIWQAIVAKELSQIGSGATRFLTYVHCVNFAACSAFFIIACSEKFFTLKSEVYTTLLFSVIVAYFSIRIMGAFTQKRLEYIADANAIILTHNPEALCDALDLAETMPYGLGNLAFVGDTKHWRWFDFHPSIEARKKHIRKIYNVLDYSHADKIRNEMKI